MTFLRATLAADGTRDRCLVPFLRWAIMQNVPGGWEAHVQYARVDARPLSSRIEQATELYPCDVLFVHRDAEGQGIEQRATEIEAALRQAGMDVPCIRVVPKRMTEAWLLIDEQAIRMAADKPGGSGDLGLPPVGALERIADPKSVLEHALCVASEKSGRQLERFKRNMNRRVQRVADLIEDREPLRRLCAFERMEAELRSTLARWTG